MSKKLKRAVQLALMVAVAMVLSFAETLIPAFAALPGIKIGLANVAVIFVLYRFGAPEAVGVSLLRVLLVSLLFGNAVGLIYAAVGAALSFAVMALLRKSARFSAVGVSVAGGVSHNVGQIGAACLLLRTETVLAYLPPLLISGAVFGVLVGLCAGILIRKIPDVF